MLTLRMPKLTKEDVQVQLMLEQCWLNPADQLSDPRDVDEINRRLDAGDLWAWADVTIQVSWRTQKASVSLGSCSYADEDEFRADGGYFDSLVDEAVDLLNNAMQETLNELVRRLNWEHVVDLGDSTPLPADLKKLTDVELKLLEASVHKERRSIEDVEEDFARMFNALRNEVEKSYQTLVDEDVRRRIERGE